MKSSIIALLIAGSLMTIFLIFTACSALNHEDDRITELEAKLDTLHRTYEELADKYNDIVTINKALISEKKLLQEENDALKSRLISLESKRPKTFTIKFANGQLYNKPASIDIATRVVNLIKAYGSDKVKITVAGYSSRNGPKAFNMKLSKDRAKGVVDKIHEAHNSGPLNIHMVAHGEDSDNERKVTITVETIE